jgi:hypothetical protein
MREKLFILLNLSISLKRDLSRLSEIESVPHWPLDDCHVAPYPEFAESRLSELEARLAIDLDSFLA